MKLKNILAVACVIAFIGAAPAFAAKTLLKDNALASYYGAQYHGRPTSSGEIFDMYGMTAAHRSLPFGTMLEITNLENGNSVVVRVNDRGPFVEGREIDVSLGAAEKLGMITSGVARVSISILDETETSARTAQQESPSPAPEPVLPAPAAQPALSLLPAYPSAADSSAVYPAWTAPPPAEEPAVPAPDPDSPLWRIQLGAFAREENALRLVRIVRAAGLEPAYERSDETIRVVIAAIEDSELENVKGILREAGIYDYILRRER